MTPSNGLNLHYRLKLDELGLLANGISGSGGSAQAWPAIVGGTSIFGGEGAVWRAVVGVMFILCIGNAFILLGIDSEYETLAEGILILAAVSLNQLVRRRT